MGGQFACLLLAAFTRDGLSRYLQGRTMVMFRGSPVPAEANPVRLESAGASALHITLPFGFNPGGTMGTQEIGV